MYNYALSHEQPLPLTPSPAPEPPLHLSHRPQAGSLGTEVGCHQLVTCSPKILVK